MRVFRGECLARGRHLEVSDGSREDASRNEAMLVSRFTVWYYWS